MGTNSRRARKKRGARRQYVQLHRAGAKRIDRYDSGMAEYKKFGAAKKLIVAGCWWSATATNPRTDPRMDAVVGTGEIETFLRPSKDNCDSTRERGSPSLIPLPHLRRGSSRTPRHAAYIKIAKAAIIRARSASSAVARKIRSRRFESVVREAESLAGAGSVKSR